MQHWVSPALVICIKPQPNWSHCDLGPSARCISPSYPGTVLELSLILQSSQWLSLIKYAAGAALDAGITLPSGAVCHSNVAKKKWWMGPHLCSPLPGLRSECLGDSVWETRFSFACISPTAGQTPLPAYCSVCEFYLRHQWFCLDRVLFASNPSPSWPQRSSSFSVSTWTYLTEARTFLLMGFHCRRCRKCIISCSVCAWNAYIRVNILFWSVDRGHAEGYYCCCLSDPT